VILLPDAPTGFKDFDDDEGDYLSYFGDRFRSNRGLHSRSVYAVEIKTVMFDACGTKPVLVLGWTKPSADSLAKKM